MRRLFRHKYTRLLVAFAIFSTCLVIKTGSVSAAPGTCAVPSPNYGSVTNIPLTVGESGNYRIWARIQTSSTSNNFKLQLDNTDCYTVGGSGTAAKAVGEWQWVDFDGAIGTKNNKNNLSQGQHTLTMYGTGEGLLVDRVIFTLITDATTGATCNPDNFIASDGTAGANCASVVNVAPTVSISSLPSSGTAPLTTTVTANPFDSDGTISSVELFNGSTSLGKKTNPPWSWDVPGLVAGTYSLTAKAIDNGGAVTTSSPTSVTVVGAASVIGDCTGDTHADIDDLTKMGTNWNKSGASYSDCNFSPDTTVNIDDLTILANNWSP